MGGNCAANEVGHGTRVRNSDAFRATYRPVANTVGSPLRIAFAVLLATIVYLIGDFAQAADRKPLKLRYLPGEVDGAIYVRTDTDKTTVISPRAHLRKAVITPRTNVDIVYTADIWSGASIDVRTAATGTVVEQRDEIVVGADHEEGIAAFGAGYRYSREYDYLSNSVNAFASVDTFKRTAKFETRVTASFDNVGRAGDEFFDEDSRTFGWWLGYTQVLSKRALMQLAYEIRGTLGYQASPYRYVSLGGNGLCGAPAALCIPETLPHRRIKHALVARARGAVTDRFSVGGGYRFYFDEWRVFSNTLMADVGFQAKPRLNFAFEYRFYWQNKAFFYERAYDQATNGQYYTRDRELSPLHNSRVNARVEWAKPFGPRNNELKLGTLVGGTLYSYRNFIGLRRVGALEVSASAGVLF